MATITTISAGDFERGKRAISLAISDALLEREDKDSVTNNAEGRAVLAQRAAERFLATLGIKVVDQDRFRD